VNNIEGHQKIVGTLEKISVGMKKIRIHGQKLTNNQNEKFFLVILGSQAKLKNNHKGESVKRGLRAKCVQGWRPCIPPLRYLHDKFADKEQKKEKTLH
jgi:hypothetical protein